MSDNESPENEPSENEPSENEPSEKVPDKPRHNPYSRQIFLCTHTHCAADTAQEATWKRLLELNKEAGLNRWENPRRVKCTQSGCLGVCSGGPVAVVYPEGIWYHAVDEAAVERIHQEHLVEGRPVEDLIFDRHDPKNLSPEVETVPDAETGDPAAASDDPGMTDEEAEAYRAKVRKDKKTKGLLIVNTGNGKGKTTAALGILMRSTGRRFKTAVVQFLKPPKARFGEIVAGREMGIDWVGTGDGWTWKSKDLDESEARARHGWSVAQDKIKSGDYDVVLLDEFTYPLHYGWLDTAQVLAWIRDHKPPKMHLIITGRYAPEELIDAADLVTEMRPVKHPFAEQGIKAQPGIEF